MKKMPLFLGVAFAALTLASCEKELEQVTTASPQISAASSLAKPDLLATNAWHQTGLTVSTAAAGSETAPVSDLFAHSKATMLVASAVYKADGTYSQQRGTRAGSAAVAPTTGTWQLNAAADSLILTQADHKQRLAVAELTPTTLRLTYSQAAENGKVSTYTSVFSH